jgi:hypothetical protein
MEPARSAHRKPSSRARSGASTDWENTSTDQTVSRSEWSEKLHYSASRKQGGQKESRQQTSQRHSVTSTRRECGQREEGGRWRRQGREAWPSRAEVGWGSWFTSQSVHDHVFYMGRTRGGLPLNMGFQMTIYRTGPTALQDGLPRDWAGIPAGNWVPKWALRVSTQKTHTGEKSLLL